MTSYTTSDKSQHPVQSCPSDLICCSSASPSLPHHIGLADGRSTFPSGPLPLFLLPGTFLTRIYMAYSTTHLQHPFLSCFNSKVAFSVRPCLVTFFRISIWYHLSLPKGHTCTLPPPTHSSIPLSSFHFFLPKIYHCLLYHILCYLVYCLHLPVRWEFLTVVPDYNRSGTFV